MTTIAIYRTRDGVPVSADSATLTITNALGVVSVPPTIVVPTAPGVYSYEASVLAPGSYTATWVFTTVAQPTDTVSRAFSVDEAVEVSEGVTLMELERLVARRIGPYRRLKVGPSGSSPNLISIPRLRSSLDIGGYEDQYILRRGLTWDDTLISNFNADDRIRLVDTYDSIAGTLSPDRSYALAPAANEAIELHVLDPDEELRLCVIDGLKRCFFWDTLSISVTGQDVYNMDLSTSAPWLTNQAHIRDVSLSYPSQLMPPTRLQWWDPYRSGKTLKMYTKGGAVGSVTLQVLRPAHTLVNNTLSYTGPDDDFDALYVDADYAAWAGVLEAWKNHPEVLMPLAVQMMRLSREDAANVFTTKSLAIANQIPDRRQIDFGREDLMQIGNLAEPV